jgi:predicted GNAT family N-acyltransferase
MSNAAVNNTLALPAGLYSAEVGLGSERFEQILQLRHEALDVPAGMTEFQGVYAEDLAINAVHLALLERNNDRVVAAVRLTLTEQEAHANRFAVDPTVQRGGMGKALFQSCERMAIQEGIGKITLYARPTSPGFYEKCGCVATGRYKEAAGLIFPHMEKTLAL